MLNNTIIGGSPDGLVYAEPHAGSAVGILEVKCPYSLRDREICCDSQCHHPLHYLECDNEVKKMHQYYQKIQGEITVIRLDCCDFVIWTPKIERIYLAYTSSMRSRPRRAVLVPSPGAQGGFRHEGVGLGQAECGE